MCYILSVNTALSKMPFYILGTKCTSCLLRRCIYPLLPLLFASTCLNLQATFIYPLKYLLSFMWLWMQVWILWRSSLKIVNIPREESVLDVRERTHKGCLSYRMKFIVILSLEVTILHKPIAWGILPIHICYLICHLLLYPQHHNSIGDSRWIIALLKSLSVGHCVWSSHD